MYRYGYPRDPHDTWDPPFLCQLPIPFRPRWWFLSFPKTNTLAHGLAGRKWKILWGTTIKTGKCCSFYRGSLDLPLHFCWQCWWIFLYKHLHLGKMIIVELPKNEGFLVQMFFSLFKCQYCQLLWVSDWSVHVGGYFFDASESHL